MARAFVGAGSARVIAAALAVAAIARICVGGRGRGDLVALGSVAVLTGPVEWVIHLRLLHSDPDSFVARRLGIGADHRRHHLDPTDLRFVLLRAGDAAVFVIVLAAFTLAWATPLMTATGSAVMPSVLTALGATCLGLLHYEWTHLLVHTGYRPRSRFYHRLARNHRNHHYRNERYWLGVTSNLGDRLMQTLPASHAAVPRSETARSLDDETDPSA